MRTVRLMMALALALVFSAPASAQSFLKGSPASMNRQAAQAKSHGFPRFQTPAEVRRAVGRGELVPVKGNNNYRVNRVSFPYTRPTTKLFVERLSDQYPDRCGKLVVTSLTRSVATQPRNASPKSVHPMGMAVDFRVPRSVPCRNWLEGSFGSLELNAKVIEATRERRPVHYHIAVFPKPYATFVGGRTGKARVTPKVSVSRTHRVRRGETLSGIANRFGTTVAKLKSTNGLRGNTIRSGQRLKIPS